MFISNLFPSTVVLLENCNCCAFHLKNNKDNFNEFRNVSSLDKYSKSPYTEYTEEKVSEECNEMDR